MSVIDTRVAKLEFDNSKFEKNVKQSRSTLQQFDKDLNKIGDNDALDNIRDSAKSIPFSSIEENVSRLTGRFSMLGIIGMTALQNITNRAVNMGIGMAKALTIEPVTTGLQEYELKMDNIRTTMTNTGADLKTVNRVLDDLNTYSDKTIYKFSDMTTALARLTTNGVTDLNLAKTVIQGMANAAAYAGLSNEKLQSIMYNTSQAYSLGYMSLIDFRSLEQAGIGNKFKEVAIETAVELGTLQKTADGTYKSIVDGEKSFEVTVENMRNTLQGKWLTNDVMTKTFEKYTDESTALGKAASKAATEITTASKLWDTWKEAAQSGWAQNWQLIIGDYEEATKLWTSLNEIVAGENGFLTKFNDRISDILKRWRMLSGRLTLITSFKKMWSAFVDVLGTAKKAFKDVFPADYSNFLVNLTRKFYSFTNSLKMSDDTAKKLQSVFKGLFSVFKIGKNALNAVSRIFRLMVPGLKGTAGGFLDNASSLGELLSGLADYLEKNDSIFKSLKKVYDFASKVYHFLVNGAKAAIQLVEDAFGIDIRIPTFDEVLAWVTDVREFFRPVTDMFSSFGKFVKGAFDGIKNALRPVFGKDGIFGSGGIDGKTILGIGVAFAALFHAKEAIDPLKMLVDIFTKGFSKAINFAGILDDLGDALSGLVANVRIDGLLKIAFAVGLLTLSLTVLSAINPERLTQAIGLLASLMAGILGTGKAMTKLFAAARDWKTLAQDTIAAVFGVTAADAMIKVAGAVLILSAALWVFSKVDPKRLVTAIIGMVASVGILVGALLLLKKVPVRTVGSIGAGMLMLSVGVLVLSAALKILSTISFGEMGTALLGFVVSMIMIVAALKYLSTDAHPLAMLSAAASMVAVGIAAVALAAALKILSTIPAENIAGTLIMFASAVAVTSVAIAALSMLDPGKLLAAAAAMLIASVGMVALAAAIGILAMVGEAGNDALGLLAGALLMIGVALLALSFIPTGGLLGAAAAILIVSIAMIALSASVAILAAGLTMLNSVNIGGIADGFFALAGPLAITGAALVVVAVGIVALSAALLVFAPAVLVLDGVAIAFGIFAAAAELVADAISTSATSFDIFVSAVERLVSVKGQLGGAGKAVAGAVSEMKKAVNSAARDFKTEGETIVTSIQAGIDASPLTLDTKIQSLLDISGQTFDTSAIVDNVIASIATGLSMVDFGGLIGGALTSTMTNTSNGAMTVAANNIVSALSTAFGSASSVGKLRASGEGVANGVKTGAESVDMSSTGGYFVQGFANGIRLNTYIAEAAASYMAAQAKAAADAQIKVHSPSREMMKTGGFFTKGFAIGIADATSKAVNAAKNMAAFTMAAVDSILNDSRDYDGIVPVLDMSDVYNTMAEFDGVWRPTIRPTLDMSSVNPGMLNMNAVAAQQAAGYRLDGTPATVAAQNPAPASFNFTQNNYSPKPLSRTEIYRQTKNQFASIEGLVNSR